MEEQSLAPCQLCERMVSSLSKHHLVPRQEGGTHGETVLLCKSCHSTLHHTYTNKTLANVYNTLEKLKTSEDLQGYLKWIKKQDKERVRIKTRKDKQ